MGFGAHNNKYICIVFSPPDCNRRRRIFTGSCRSFEPLAGFHRRSGIAPCPEDDNNILIISILVK